MKDFIKKIINSFLAITFAFGIILVTYHMTRYEMDSLSASIMDGDGFHGVAEAGDINAVEFISPKGAAYPVNGVVTIQSVYVDFNVLAEADNFLDGILSGSDLENSIITFSSNVPACTNAVFQGNKIILPDNFTTACNVKIDIPGSPGVSNNDLVIEPVSCAALKTSILRGYGEGFDEIAPGDLGEFGVTDDTFTFEGFDFYTIDSSIDINYPTTTVEGAKTFQIHIDLVPDISVDPINGVDARAKIIANNGNGIYEIKIRDEGTDNEMQTALNFAYVFNDLMGSDTPFVAYPLETAPSTIALQTTEMGAHTDEYVCVADGNQIGPPCFDGGEDGAAGTKGEGVLTTPLKLDNEVLQGESAIVFASDSAGEIEWITSHPSILEVVTLSEAAADEAGSIDFVDETISVLEVVTPAQGAYSLLNCTVDLDENDDPINNTESCTVQASIPVEYNIAGINYTVNVSVGDEVVPVTVTGSKLTGFLEGSDSYTSTNGVGMSLSGTVIGTVTGSVSGVYSGTVTGKITATVQASGSAAGSGANGVTPAHFQAVFAIGVVTEGSLTDAPGTFTSTVKKQEDDISHVAILYAKRPGTSILSALDKQGCIASFEIDVIEKQVVLQMVGRDPGDVLDVSDTVQINAFVGGANAELEEYENITAASGIEWFSSNEEVATIDQTGLLTALKPGVTNLTARYDTGEAEIGTIESIPMQVTVNKIAGLRVTFDKGTEDKLSNEVIENAHKSVIIAIHNPEAAGQSFVIEGQTVTIELPVGTYNNDISKIDAIVNDPTDGLAKKISDLQDITTTNNLIKVTTIDGYPGMLILQPDKQNIDHDSDSIEDIDENGIIDIDTTALETDVAILPTYSNAIPLPASETYGLMVVAQYDNGATKLLPPTQFSWINTPVNYLEQALLDSGLIKLGEISGSSTVVAEYENADGSIVRSNYLTITVDSGPVIEFVRRIGSGSVTKGSRILMQTKISDVDTIADISSISTSFVYSTFNTYQQINEDSTAIWFSATPFLSEVVVVDQGSTGDTETEGEGEGETETPTPAPIVLQYKTYNIPLEIPVDANMFDGIYKLILSITDNSNHTLNYVYPIRIGEIGEGDVNGDGLTNMVDVILAFQIASGINPSPTPAELQAANVDGIGGVTLVDVILLFNKVTNKA